jgi:hypothetical protein
MNFWTLLRAVAAALVAAIVVTSCLIHATPEAAGDAVPGARKAPVFHR